VQWRAPRAIAQLNQPRLSVEELTHTVNITGRRRDVDRVIGAGRTRSTAARADIFEQANHFLMSSIPGDGHRVITIELRVRVCTCVKQQPNCVDAPFTRCEMDRLIITRQLGIALEEVTKRGRVTGSRGANRVPNIAATAQPLTVREVSCKFFRLDHVDDSVA